MAKPAVVLTSHRLTCCGWLRQLPSGLPPAAPACTLRTVAEAIKRDRATNTDLCEELDAFCASRGRAVEVATFTKFPRQHQVAVLRKWCGDGESAFYELCDRLGLLAGA